MAATIYGPVTGAATWGALGAHAGRLATTTLRELFASDPGRVGGLTVTACGIHADLSKQRVTTETLQLLVRLARERGVPERISAMFAGEKINATEDALGAAHRAADAPRRLARRRRRSTSCPRCTTCSTGWRAFAGRGALGGVGRLDRRADRRQSSTSASAAPTSVR